MFLWNMFLFNIWRKDFILYYANFKQDTPPGIVAAYFLQANNSPEFEAL